MSTDSPVTTAIVTEEHPLRFDVAHPNAPTKATTCSSCAQQVSVEYFEVNGDVVCGGCRAKIDQAKLPAGRRRRFARAFGFGVVAMLVGAAGYSAFRIATGYDVGLVAIVVGYIVGKAVHVGSRKRGGRGYQFLAIALTYGAISLSYVPSLAKEFQDKQSTALDSAKTSATSPSSTSAAATASAGRAPVLGPDGQPVGLKGLLLGFGAAALLVIALPVFVGFSSIISVALLAFALMQAWRMNGAVRMDVTGPYRIGRTLESEGAPASQQG